VTRQPSPTQPRRPPGRPRKVPFEERERRLLDAAVVAFAERGSSSVTVDAIATRVGINKALVYEHFVSKDELFAAAVRRERDRLVVFIAARYVQPVGGPIRERIRAQYHAFVDFTAEHPHSTRLLALPEASALFDGQGRDALSTALAGHLRRELAEGGLPTDELPHILAAMFVGMAGGVLRRVADAPWDPEAVVDLLTSFTMAGLSGTAREVLERADRPTSRDQTGEEGPPRART
jgi:AcrR family transcriptional regulator